jgi:hypothetical protein
MAETEKSEKEQEDIPVSPTEGKSELPSSSEEIESQVEEGLADKFAPEEKKEEESEPDVFDEKEVKELKRPEGLEDKFWDKKSGVKSEDLSMAYKELRDHISKGQHKAPKDGKYDNKVFENLEPNHPTVPIYNEWAKKHGISQLAFNELAQKVINESNLDVEQEKINIEKEIEKLGPNAQDRIKANGQWFNGLKNKGIFTEAEEDIFKIAAADATGQRFIEKVRNMIGDQVPHKLEPTGEELQSLEDIKAQIGSKQYKEDPAFRAKVYASLKRATGKDPESPIE